MHILHTQLDGLVKNALYVMFLEIFCTGIIVAELPKLPFIFKLC